MRILTVIATIGLFAASATTAVQADGHDGNKCVPYGCYDR
jgi:hypothetical protein